MHLVKDVSELQTGGKRKKISMMLFLSNIDFSYPNTEENIFNHLSLKKIQKGKNCEVIGMSGSGKSTL